MTDSTIHIPLIFEQVPTLKVLGARAKEKRKHEGISIKRLAAIVGCSHVAVIELEKGSGKMNISTAWRILDALGLIENDPKPRPISIKAVTTAASRLAQSTVRNIKPK